ncbi:MAG TPA: hypothetical protein VHU80_10040, partial [Polyangiaceae bacterium]|nr:hypothetical protein [Polyangiaceae bacterium]
MTRSLAVVTKEAPDAVQGARKRPPARRPQDWRWQLQNSVRTARDLDAVLALTEDERAGALAAE